MTAQPSEHAYLRSYLAPFSELLARPDVTDIYVNRPGEVWVETLSEGPMRRPAPGLNADALEILARQVASVSHQGVSRAHPLLAATLPDGCRVQFVLPPATREFTALAIRRQVAARIRLDDYARAAPAPEAEAEKADAALARRLAAGDIVGFLRAAVRARKNILISGGTASGKTTFLNSLLREVAAEERLVVIEDTPEIELPHDDAVGLVAVRGDLGESGVCADDLVRASLRLRPDRIILGELRGQEAFSFLRAVNSGHPGSMTTIHADTPDGAFEQLALLVLQAGTGLSRDDILGYARRVIEVSVQLNRRSGVRSISDVRFNPALR